MAISPARGAPVHPGEDRVRGPFESARAPRDPPYGRGGVAGGGIVVTSAGQCWLQPASPSRWRLSNRVSHGWSVPGAAREGRSFCPRAAMATGSGDAPHNSGQRRKKSPTEQRTGRRRPGAPPRGGVRPPDSPSASEYQRQTPPSGEWGAAPHPTTTDPRIPPRCGPEPVSASNSARARHQVRLRWTSASSPVSPSVSGSPTADPAQLER